MDLRKIHPGMEIKVTVVWVGGTLSDSHEKPVATTLDCTRVETTEPECKCTFVSAHDKIDRLGNCDSGLTPSRAPHHH